MANEKNLIPNSERTPEERREIAAAGGIASGAARRRKRSLKEAADLYLSKPVTDNRVKGKVVRAGIDEDDVDYQMAIIAGLAGRAIKGDSKAAKTIFELLGDTAGTENTVDPVKVIIDV